ncbi:HNH endonuclease family protein [Actinoplanes oblitus]|uniref:HNH endonuclease family protein n=1 Tax=Actinoplanes oblitus TaxID=3040509 RepID=A0ABY8WEK0_9ACTN|nr:HNH endonuclease family protein [Actinoplanes oblitus]WIM96281.1 HNH endonuclease family protein [Actinoplanes oblitus]
MPPRNWLPLFLAATLLTGCQTVDAGSPGATTKPATKPAPKPSGNASALLTKLTVVTKTGTMAGYSREKFPHWDSTGKNCDTRDSVLERDGTKVKTSGCNVVAGTWKSFYDGALLNSPTKVDIDHTVPLANAWRSGANKWTTAQREAFANDLDRPQLLAVSATSNRSKGDQDPSTWKPPAKDAWCAYAEDWITVKSYYKLTVTQKEKDALTDMLETCG